MSKILDLRKKIVKVPQPLQKPREEIGVAKQSAMLRDRQNSDKPHISWEAPTFYYNPQKRYLSVLIAALIAGAVALLIFKYSTLTSIFLILSSLVLLLYSNQKPTVSKISVNQSGVLVDDITYPYKNLKSFWIEYNPGGSKELSLESAKWYMPYIKIFLSNQNPIELRSLIISFLPEKEHENSLVDQIGRKLGL